MLATLQRKIYSAWTDLRHGGLLTGRIKSRNAGAFDIENSGYDVLRTLFVGNVRDGDVLVDIGCGKGRVLNWWADNYPIQAGYGIELNHAVGTNTKHRFRRSRNIKVIIGDAIKNIPADASLFYLGNPFGESVMRDFCQRLIDAPRAANGTLRRIIYYNCTCLSAFDAEVFAIKPLSITGPHASAIIDLRA